MSKTKVAITIDQNLLAELDQLVAQNIFANRSNAFQEAIREKLARINRTRLARECAKLDSRAEQQLAEEGIDWEWDAWPEY